MDVVATFRPYLVLMYFLFNGGYSLRNPKFVPITKYRLDVVYCVGLILILFFQNFPNVNVFCSRSNTLPSLVDWAFEICDDLLGWGDAIPTRNNEPTLMVFLVLKFLMSSKVLRASKALPFLFFMLT
jgi:hypothetical protein